MDKETLALLNVTQGRREMINRFNQLKFKLQTIRNIFDDAVEVYHLRTGINLYFFALSPSVRQEVRDAFILARDSIVQVPNPLRDIPLIIDTEDVAISSLDPILQIGDVLNEINFYKQLSLTKLHEFENAINRAEIAVEQFEIAVGLKTRTGRSVQRKKIKRKK